MVRLSPRALPSKDQEVEVRGWEAGLASGGPPKWGHNFHEVCNSSRAKGTSPHETNKEKVESKWSEVSESGELKCGQLDGGCPCRQTVSQQDLHKGPPIREHVSDQQPAPVLCPASGLHYQIPPGASGQATTSPVTLDQSVPLATEPSPISAFRLPRASEEEAGEDMRGLVGK